MSEGGLAVRAVDTVAGQRENHVRGVRVGPN